MSDPNKLRLEKELAEARLDQERAERAKATAVHELEVLKLRAQVANTTPSGNNGSSGFSSNNNLIQGHQAAGPTVVQGPTIAQGSSSQPTININTGPAKTIAPRRRPRRHKNTLWTACVDGIGAFFDRARANNKLADDHAAGNNEELPP